MSFGTRRSLPAERRAACSAAPRTDFGLTEDATHPTLNQKERRMLGKAKVAARLPAKDLDRVRTFYSEKLGLDPVEQREGGLRYICASGEFAIFVSAGVQS